MTVRVFVVSSLAVAAAVMAACSSSSSEVGIIGADAAGEGSMLPSDDGATDGGSDGPTDSASGGTCEGACKTTSLVADFGGKKRTLTRAQLGTQTSDAGVAQLHTESHLGGAPQCPTMQSPSPDYTLIVSSIPRGQTGKKVTDLDGVTSAFFDFKGDLGLPPLTKAITVYATVVGEDPATPPRWVALDVSAAFREGTVSGHLYAEYCASLSE